MIENSKNKKIAGNKSPTKVDLVPIRNIDTGLYHFSGSGLYFPLLVHASSEDDAVDIWLKKRVPYKK